MWIKARLILLTAILLNTATGVIASEDSTKMQALTSQVSALRAEIDQLKAAVELLNAIKPDVTTLMPDIAERMHVMHYAGEGRRLGDCLARVIGHQTPARYYAAG